MAQRAAIAEYRYGPWRFVGHVARDGYQWIETDQGLWLVDAETGGRSLGARDYQPTLRQPVHRAMHAVYAQYQPDDATLPAAVLGLANRYGDLCANVGTPCEQDGQPVFRYGIALDAWVQAIRWVGRLTALWDDLRHHDVARLGRLVQWYPNKGKATAVAITWGFDRHDRWGGDAGPVIARREGRRESLFRQLMRLDGATATETVARFALADELNERLSTSVSMELLPVLNTGKQKLIGVSNAIGEAVVPVGDEPIGRYDLLGALVPHDLRAVALLQLYSEVTGARTYQPCTAPNCGEWFDTSEHRKDQRYCSVACIKRAQRARQRARSELSGDTATDEQV